VWEIVASVSVRLLDLVYKLIQKPRIKLRVKELQYDSEQNEPNSSIVSITPYPSCYYARIEFSNIGGKLTTIKEITLIVDGKLKLPQSKSRPKPFKLEPGGFQEEIVIFPVERGVALKEGLFEIQAIDAFETKFKGKGRFPVCCG